MESNFMDEIDCGNFFDQIDDLIAFPPENEGGGGNFVNSGDCKGFPSMWNDGLQETDVLFSGNHGTIASDLSVPYEDIIQLEWLSNFVEDSFLGEGMTVEKENLCVNKEPSHNHFQSSSPVSFLESSSSSSSSCSGRKSTPLSPNCYGTQRARSKRPRPTTFNPRAATQLISPSSSFIETPKPFVAPGFSSEAENFAESPPVKKMTKLAGSEQKKKKIKFALPANPTEMHLNTPPQSVRKCLHCEITKTPQWRAGPMGPKTLCNACGVRHKSGRLFPEYRPAASPTFVPSLHSNSHKKVIEMRNRVEPKSLATTTPIAAKPYFIPNTLP